MTTFVPTRDLADCREGTKRSGREDSSRRCPQSPRDYLRFAGGEYKRWRKKNVISAKTIDATLRWIRKNTFGERGLADFFGDIVFACKRLARGFILDELDAEEQ